MQEIYDEHSPKEAGTSTPRKRTPKQINTPTRSKTTPIKSEVSLGIAENEGLIVKRKDFIKTMEKYKVDRIQYLPTIEKNMIDSLIVSVKPLPRKLQVGGQNVQITKTENMNVEKKKTNF